MDKKGLCIKNKSLLKNDTVAPLNPKATVHLYRTDMN